MHSSSFLYFFSQALPDMFPKSEGTPSQRKLRAFSPCLFYLSCEVLGTLHTQKSCTRPQSSFLDASVLLTLSRQFSFHNAQLSPVLYIFCWIHPFPNSFSFFSLKDQAFISCFFVPLAERLAECPDVSQHHISIVLWELLLLPCLWSWSYTAEMSGSFAIKLYGSKNILKTR